MENMSRREERVERYRVALLSCPTAGGGVHGWMMGAANFAAAAGVPPEEAEREIGAAMTRRPSPPGELREAIRKAYGERERRVVLGLGPVPPKPKPKAAAKSAREFIRRGGAVDEADLWEASPVRIDWGEEWWRDAVALLHALFRPGELVFCGERYGKTVRERDEWCRRWERGEAIPPFVGVNPLKAEGGMTGGGKPSPRCDGAVAVFRHAVAEFDGMPLGDQVKFWMGWGLEAVTAITFSGGKSLHAILRVNAASREKWDEEVRNTLFGKSLIPLGCDKTCVNPSRLTRLAGARREEKGGAVQKLLFVRGALP